MAGTLRTRSALDALFADNTAGDISAQDLRDLLWSTEQIFDYNDTTVTTGNVSAAAGEFHRLTISGMTADRDFIMPTCSVGDNPIGFQLVSDAPADHELVLKGDTGVTVILKGEEATAAEVTRYLIDNESAIFEAVGTNTWLCVHDGRIPIAARIDGGSALTTQSLADETWVVLDNTTLDTALFDNAGVADTSNGRLNFRREGLYSLNAALFIATASTGDCRLNISGETNINILLSDKSYVNGKQPGALVSGFAQINTSVDGYVYLRGRMDTDDSSSTSVQSGPATFLEYCEIL